MKTLKRIVIGLIIIIVLLIVVALFLPSNCHVERSIVIKSPPANVFTQVNNYKNWPAWSPWEHLDPNMKITYEGPEAGVGAKYSWKSEKKNVGNGSMWITESKPDSFVNNTMEFEGMGQSTASFKIEKAPEGSKIIWAMDSKGEGLPWYMVVPSRYMSMFFMDKMVGADFEKGLNTLKDVTEKMPPPVVLPEIKPEELTTKDQKAITTHITCSKEEIGANFKTAMEKLGAYAKQNHAKMTGPPFAVYHKWDKEFDFDAGIPIDKKIASGKDVNYMEMKGQKAVKVDYHGNYMNMEPTYMAFGKWMKDNNKKPNGDSWEVYVTDPMKEKDTSKWLTQIYFPM